MPPVSPSIVTPSYCWKPLSIPAPVIFRYVVGMVTHIPLSALNSLRTGTSALLVSIHISPWEGFAGAVSEMV